MCRDALRLRDMLIWPRHFNEIVPSRERERKYSDAYVEIQITLYPARS